MPFDDQLSQFWAHAKAELASVPLEAEVEEVEDPESQYVRTSSVRVTSFGGVRVRAMLSIPRMEVRRPLPVVMMLPGYGGGMAHNPLLSRLEGVAWMSLYPRGQGLSAEEWRLPSDTQLTYGLDDPAQQYYLGAYLDCVRGLDFLCSLPELDASRIGICGGSQGGGLTLATCALDDRPIAAYAHVPFLCNYAVAVETATTGPYLELTNWLREHPEQRGRAMDTLGYFDPLNLAENVRCPIMLTIGNQDTTCPPPTIYPIFDVIPSIKALVVWPELGHAWHHEARQLMVEWLRRYLVR